MHRVCPVKGNLIVGIAVVLLTGLSQTPAFAGNPLSGNWQSRSGNVVKIGNQNDNFDVIFERPDGKHTLYQGKWIKFGHKFFYRDNKGERCVCALDAMNGDIIHNEFTHNDYTRLK